MNDPFPSGPLLRLFGDDNDNSILSVNNGISLAICQDSTIIHKENQSIKKNRMKYYSIINRLKFASKYYPNSIKSVYISILMSLFKSFIMLDFYTIRKTIQQINK